MAPILLQLPEAEHRRREKVVYGNYYVTRVVCSCCTAAPLFKNGFLLVKAALKHHKIDEMTKIIILLILRGNYDKSSNHHI